MAQRHTPVHTPSGRRGSRCLSLRRRGAHIGMTIVLALTITSCSSDDYTAGDPNQPTPPATSTPATRNPSVSDTRRPGDGYAGFSADQMNQAVQFLSDYIYLSNVDPKTVCVATIDEFKRLSPYMTPTVRADYERALGDGKTRTEWVSSWSIGKCTTPPDGRAAEDLQAQPVRWSGVPTAPNELAGTITFAVTLRTINPEGQLVRQRIHRDMSVTLQLTPDGWVLSDYGCDWRTEPVAKGG